MTLQQLEYALALKKYGSFNKAAKLLNISQPALSTQIKKLEDHLGLILFNRGVQPIETTPEGLDFLKRSALIVNESKKLKSYAQQLGERHTGRLSIGIIPTLAPYLLPLISKDFETSYPEIILDVSELLTSQVISGIMKGDLDAGIIATPTYAAGIDEHPLFYERFFIYGNQSHIQAAEEIDISTIDHRELWLLGEGNCFRDQASDLCKLKEKTYQRRIAYRSNSIDALIRIVDTHGGLTVLPELSLLTLTAEQEESIFRISGHPKAREISMVTTKHYDKAVLLDALKQTICENVPRHMLTKDELDVVDPKPLNTSD